MSKPTRRSGSLEGVRACRASDRSVGPILAAQPQVRDKPIKVFFFMKNIAFLSRPLQSQQSLKPGSKLGTFPVQPLPPKEAVGFLTSFPLDCGPDRPTSKCSGLPMFFPRFQHRSFT
ncbi:MAG: hypothetical protein BBJ60_00480 [Desulfobacterales bacterium S7086C20]|nr:MAG: hypothetical protein BBJ60_00480 [Desulfobacterales bacterium S7086C20]